MRFSSVGTAVLAVFAMASCVDRDVPTQPTSSNAPESLSELVLRAETGRTPYLDEEWRQVADLVPGFAGVMLDDQGLPVVMVSSDRDAPAARAYAAAAYHGATGRDAPSVSVKEVKYSYRSLDGWRRSILNLRPEGLVMLDVDEARNQIELGIAEPDESLLASISGTLGIPADAIHSRVLRGNPDRALLTGSGGGVGGTAVYRRVGVDSVLPATLTFTARWVDHDSAHVFVTASHASLLLFQTDTTLFEQRNQSSLSYDAGREVYDPTYYAVGTTCSGGFFLCRGADATLVGHDNDTIPDTLGIVYRTTSVGIGSAGSKTIASTDPKFTILDVLTSHSQLYVNAWMDKVGQKTGWTRGKITRTCFDVIAPKGLYCQYESATYSDVGDSGSPMFVSYNGRDAGIPDGGPYIRLMGILWGGVPGVPDTSFFSPYDGIENDLGDLAVCIDYAAAGC